MISILIGGTGSFYFISKTDSKISSVENSTTNMGFEDVFKKKQECASYHSNIRIKLSELDFQNEKIAVTNYLDEIWFSPSQNTCMYSVIEFWEDLKENKISYQYNIYDYLSNKLILNISEIPNFVNRVEALNAFNNQKEELKK